MFEIPKIRSYDYVNRPYEAVRDALRADAAGLFARATSAAKSRSHALTSLHVKVGGLDIAAEAIVAIAEIPEVEAGMHGMKTRFALDWRAAHATGWFPVMEGELSIYPLSKDETQLDFEGQYQPPLGVLGGAIDLVIGRRIAEASVRTFIESVATRLRLEAPGNARA